MNVKLITIAVLTIFSLKGFTQTLYIPSGTGGIGSSSTTNVGIGISNPNYKLHLNSTTNGWSSVIQNQGCIVYSAYGNGSSDGYGMHIKVNNQRSDRYALQVYDGIKNLFYIKNDGNIGAGCDPGGTTFKIYKAELPLFELANSISRLQIGVANSAWNLAHDSKPGDVIFRPLGGTDGHHGMILYLPNDTNDGKSYVAFGDDANNLWMKILNNRTVRIDGTVFSREINVRTNVWADYVFHKNYQLKPLEEVEVFIRTNKRLPDIPSEKEVKENGINLAEMNALLLKKVEEAMLYIIELKKQNENLTKRIEELENQ